jgi:hypothetical protein
VKDSKPKPQDLRNFLILGTWNYSRQFSCGVPQFEKSLSYRGATKRKSYSVSRSNGKKSLLRGRQIFRRWQRVRRRHTIKLLSSYRTGPQCDGVTRIRRVFAYRTVGVVRMHPTELPASYLEMILSICRCLSRIFLRKLPSPWSLKLIAGKPESVKYPCQLYQTVEFRSISGRERTRVKLPLAEKKNRAKQYTFCLRNESANARKLSHLQALSC